MKKNNSKATVEVKANVTNEQIATISAFESRMGREMKAKAEKEQAEKRVALIELTTAAISEEKPANVEEITATEENAATEKKPAKKKGNPPKQEKLAVAKTNATGQYIIFGLYDGDGPMLYLIDNNNKKIRINSAWGYEMLQKGAAVRVDQKAIDEFKGKTKKAEKTAAGK